MATGELILPDSELFVRYACHQYGHPAFFDRKHYDQIEKGAELALCFTAAYTEYNVDTGETVEESSPRREREFTVSIQKIKMGELAAEMSIRRWPENESKCLWGDVIIPSAKSVSLGDSMLIMAEERGNAHVANLSKVGTHRAILDYRQALENFGMR